MATVAVKRKLTDRKMTTWQRKVTNKFIIPIIAMVNFTILAVSLDHLADGFSLVFAADVWIGYAMAISVDLGMVVAEVTAITLRTVVPTAVQWANRYVIGTLMVSMLFNTMAFWPVDGDYPHKLLAATMGALVPGMVWTLTRMAGGIWLNANRQRGGYMVRK